jgi:tetratricopeptide (TPR) repeat protein
MTSHQEGALQPAADEALARRDEALGALDAGDLQAALSLIEQGLGLLRAAGLDGGLDEAALLIALAEIDECAGNLGSARSAAEAALVIVDGAITDGAIGDDADDDAGTTLLWCQAQELMASLEQLSGEYPAAMNRLDAALTRAAAAFGESSLAVVSAANSLGMARKAAGELDGAEAAYRRAEAALRGLVDPDPLIEAGLLHNRGGLAHARGDAAAGIPQAERGAALRTSLLGADHPDVARDLNALGALYQLGGRLDEAGRAYEQALAVFGHSYGPDHFEVAMTCANLAALQAELGRYEEAEALGRRSMRILADILGPQDAEVGLTLLNLATAVAGQGRSAEALALARQSVRILAARLPAGHPHLEAASQVLASYAESA